MDKLFGLPSHPLLVHLPVVLVPTVALCAVLLAARRDWRQRFGLALVIAAGVAFVAMFLAKQSGEALFERMNQAPAIRRHESLADTSMVLTLLLFISVVVMVGHQRRSKARTRTRLALVSSIITVVLAVLTTVGIVQTGHEGAKVTWEQTAKAP
jgi:uncharacterized membrane protein